MLEKRIHIVGNLHEIAKEKFLNAGYSVTQSANYDEDRLLYLARDASVIVMTDMLFHSEWFDLLPNLKLLARRGVGYDNIPLEAATKHGVWVTNTPGANAIAVAEMAVSLMLTLLRQVNKATNNVQKGVTELNSKSLMGHNLAGKTVGIIGYGQIAKKLEKILYGFGVNILVYSRTKHDTVHADFVDYETVIKQSDIISLHIPANSETRGLFNAATFSKMKENAILINTARADLVDEKALISAITTKQISGAGLDTTSYDVVKQDSILLNHNQIIITPHIGANTVESEYLTAEKVMESVFDFFNHEKPIYTIN